MENDAVMRDVPEGQLLTEWATFWRLARTNRISDKVQFKAATGHDLPADPVEAIALLTMVGASAMSAIRDAYARYDSDPRAHGPEGFDAFYDATIPLLTVAD